MFEVAASTLNTNLTALYVISSLLAALLMRWRDLVVELNDRTLVSSSIPQPNFIEEEARDIPRVTRKAGVSPCSITNRLNRRMRRTRIADRRKGRAMLATVTRLLFFDRVYMMVVTKRKVGL